MGAGGRRGVRGKLEINSFDMEKLAGFLTFNQRAASRQRTAALTSRSVLGVFVIFALVFVRRGN